MAAKQRIHRVLFRFVTVLGAVAGLICAAAISPYFAGLPPAATMATYAAITIFGCLCGILVATPLSVASASALDSMQKTLQQLGMMQIMLGAMGLVSGLFIAFFVSLAVQTLRFEHVPLVGPWLGPTLIILSAILFGALGAFTGVQLSSVGPMRSPFAEAQKEEPAGPPQILVDTSIIVDGRLGGVIETGFLIGELVVPQFILSELQVLADSEDPLRRIRGRRGLEFLDDLRQQYPLSVVDEQASEKGADQKLIQMARRLGSTILTNDYNLQKVASVQGLRVLNLNQLAAALKPAVLPGQLLQLNLLREGKEPNQAVAYLEDGTMVVVERGKPHLGREVIAEVTSVMQTATGKMVFSKFRHVTEAQAPSEESA